MTPSAQAKQALKAAVRGQAYGGFDDDIYGQSLRHGVFLSTEAARLIDQMLTRAHYEAPAEEVGHGQE